jgi:aminoglycoside phosphotransferase (APT) family kinase protein
MSDIVVAPETRDLTQLSKNLIQWLSERQPQAAGLSVTNLTYPRGAGQSHETILFDAQWTEHGEPRTQGYVVRIQPTRFTVYVDDLFEEQFQVMQVVQAGGYVPVAKTFWLERDPALLGAKFFVMEKLVGQVPVSVPPYPQSGWVADASPQQRRHMWASGVHQLAGIQNVPLEQLGFLQGPENARDGNAQELDKYQRFIEWVKQDRAWPVLDDGLARLKTLSPRNPPPGLVWGDARFGNIMFNHNFDAIAVMDWEQPSLGGALHDLGWWLVNSEAMHGANDTRPHLEGMGTRSETIALWEKVTGKSAQEIEWFEDFARLKMSCLSVRMSALRGAPPPDERWLARRLKVA